MGPTTRQLNALVQKAAQKRAAETPEERERVRLEVDRDTIVYLQSFARKEANAQLRRKNAMYKG